MSRAQSQPSLPPRRAVRRLLLESLDQRLVLSAVGAAWIAEGVSHDHVPTELEHLRPSPAEAFGIQEFGRGEAIARFEPDRGLEELSGKFEASLPPASFQARAAFEPHGQLGSGFVSHFEESRPTHVEYSPVSSTSLPTVTFVILINRSQTYADSLFVMPMIRSTLIVNDGPQRPSNSRPLNAEPSVNLPDRAVGPQLNGALEVALVKAVRGNDNGGLVSISASANAAALAAGSPSPETSSNSSRTFANEASTLTGTAKADSREPVGRVTELAENARSARLARSDEGGLIDIGTPNDSAGSASEVEQDSSASPDTEASDTWETMWSQLAGAIARARASAEALQPDDLLAADRAIEANLEDAQGGLIELTAGEPALIAQGDANTPLPATLERRDGSLEATVAMFEAFELSTDPTLDELPAEPRLPAEERAEAPSTEQEPIDHAAIPLAALAVLATAKHEDAGPAQERRQRRRRAMDALLDR